MGTRTRVAAGVLAAAAVVLAISTMSESNEDFPLLAYLLTSLMAGATWGFLIRTETWIFAMAFATPQVVYLAIAQQGGEDGLWLVAVFFVLFWTLVGWGLAAMTAKASRDTFGDR